MGEEREKQGDRAGKARDSVRSHGRPHLDLHIDVYGSCYVPLAAVASPGPVALRAPLPMGFSLQEYWNGVLFPLPVDLPDPGIDPEFLMSLATAGEFFSTSATGKLGSVPSVWLMGKTLALEPEQPGLAVRT